MRAKPLKFQIKIIVSEPFQLKLGWFFFVKGFPYSYIFEIYKISQYAGVL